MIIYNIRNLTKLIWISDLCVGSEEETDDIIPCTWVGYNVSGSAEIKNGALWIDGVEVRKLSDLKPFQDFTKENSSVSNSFTMPVGQQMFVTMRLCNEAMLCANKSLGVVVITNSDSVVATSTNESAIKKKILIISRKRAATELDIQTPSGDYDKNNISSGPLNRFLIRKIFNTCTIQIYHHLSQCI